MARRRIDQIRIGETDDLGPRGGPAGAGSSYVHLAPERPSFMNLEPLLVSAGAVAVGEIGDKTQLLAIVLAAKFRKPLPIILGILCATVLNHTIAATLGFLVAKWLTGRIFQTVVGLAFIAMAGWALIPDKEDEGALERTRGGVFLATLVSFFFVEIGDKTQIVTSLLAARFNQITLVALGTTLGMMIADVPAVLLGEAATKVVPLNIVRMIAAGLFALLGVGMLVRAYHLI
jgi:putative Ca2+/H+ antiporter (TMEM165/GDT1 family)